MRIYRSIIGALLGLVLTVSVMAQVSEPPQPPPALDEALVVVAIPDLHGFLDGAEALKGQILPDMPPNFIKSMLGANLGDPTLSCVPVGEGAAVVIYPKHEIAFIVIEVAKDKAEGLKMAAGGMGMQTESVDSLMVMAFDPKGLNAGKALAKQAQDKWLSKSVPEAILTIKMAKTLNTFDQQINAFMAGIPMMMMMAQSQVPQAQKSSPEAMQAQTRILEAEIRVLQSLLRQIDTVTVHLSGNGDGLHVKKEISVVPGTNLAEFAARNPGTVKDLPGAFLPGNGLIRACFVCDGKALQTLATKEADTVMQAMNMTKDERKTITDLIEISLKTWSNSAALEFMPPNALSLAGASISVVEDPANALDAIRKTADFFKTDGMAGFYKSMGMPMEMKFTEKARTHNGVDIHSFNMQFDLSGMPPQQAEMTKAFLDMSHYDVAIVDKYQIQAYGDEKIENVIDQVKSGKATAKPMAAQKAFGPGQGWYVDLNLAGYVEMVGKAIAPILPAGQTNPIPVIANAMRGASPIIVSGGQDGSVFTSQATVPSDLIANMINAVKALNAPQAQQM